MSTSEDRYPGAAYIPMGNPVEDDRYIVMTKIMVLAMAVLFAAVFFVICLHIYTKWIWGSAGARPRDSFWFWPRRRRAHRNEHVTDMLDINMVVGLGKEAVEALPTFKYRKEEPGLECAICLGQFQEEELGRSLPKCGHCFHLECIDMWLFSHSTCPLCRAVLQEAELQEPDHEPEASSIQVFTQSSNLPSPPQTEQESEHEPKRADSIPANVLFWGNLMQQVGADSRHSQHRNSNSSSRNNSSNNSQQVAIDVDSMGTPRARTPRGSNSSPSS